ncbi:MAG: hypothetical protein AABY18_08985 [Candidatus Thermoplasmatota archaeon]
MSPSSRESGVSAVIGTVIVLAITVAGIATVLFMGTPVLTNLRERAALENVVGQMEEVRAAANDMYVPDESRYPTISIPAGHFALGEGSHMLITVDHDSDNTACDLRVADWEDWDNRITVTASGCRSLVTVAATCAGVASISGEACLEVAKVDGAVETVEHWTSAGPPYDLASAIDPDFDYVFRLVNNEATPVVYAQAWLLHMDRLAWSTGNVHSSYEGGGIFAQEGNGFFLASSPLVSEDPGTGPYFLRVPTLQGSEYGEFSGSGSHSIGLILRSGHVRADMVLATQVRLDFHGDLAEPWCNAFLLRDTLASLDGDYYTEDAAEPTHACSGESPDEVRSVKYDEPAAFRFTLTQTILHGSILL